MSVFEYVVYDVMDPHKAATAFSLMQAYIQI